MTVAAPKAARRDGGLTLRWILLTALVVRLALVLSMGQRFYFGDTAEYDSLATSFATGQDPAPGLPRQPLFPLLLALAYRIGGNHNFVVARLLQLGIGVLVVILCERLARRLGGPGAGLVAAGAAALAPTLVFTTGLLYPTALFTLLLLAMTLTAFDLAERPTLLSGALLGVWLALAWLTEPVAVAPGAALVAWLVVVSRGRLGALARVALALVVAAAIAAPWALSPRRSGEARVFGSKAEYVLHLARSDPELAAGRAIRDTSVFVQSQSSGLALLRRELELVRTRPLDYAHDWGREFLHFFQPMPDRVRTQNIYNRRLTRWVGALYFVPVLALALLGLFHPRIPGRWRALLAVVPLSTAAFYAFFFSQTRYRIPVEPQLLVAAALGVQRLLPRTVRIFGGSPLERTTSEAA